MDLFKPNLYINPCAIFISLIIIHIFIFHLDKIFNEELVEKIRTLCDTCVVDCDDKKTCEKVNYFRDKKYYYNDKSKKCLVSSWEISHFLMHLFLGYYSNIYVSQTASIGYEIYEHKYHDCGSYIDLIYNFAGFYTGFVLRHGKFL